MAFSDKMCMKLKEVSMQKKKTAGFKADNIKNFKVIIVTTTLETK